MVSASGTDQTELSVEGDYTVTGPLETFANAGGVHVARAILAEFAANMGRLVAERRAKMTAAESAVAAVMVGPTPQSPNAAASPSTTVHPRPAAAPPPPPQPAPAAELNAFAILWAAFKSWLQGLFGKRN